MLNSNYYSIYLNSVLQLAETIVIKSTETAEALNKYVTDYYGDAAVNKLDPTTWKYYQNISGEYHPTDDLMYVISIDTLERVLFTKETLGLHRATAAGYVYGTRQYKELVAQYPNQEMLILGILYPVDINIAIVAEDGIILGYPSNLVEGNEYSFITKLQKWISGYKVRWTNVQFGITNDLYTATNLGMMYMLLVPTILNIRLEACKTNEAHSFHIRQYLASHGFLDAYMDDLTKKQALFFYRNIAYIERNVGKQYIFDWLVEHIMTERKLPLAEYVMRHDLTKQPDELYPELVFRKNPINLGYSRDANDNISLDQILNKEALLARDNVLVQPFVRDGIEEAMKNSLSNVVLTKVLESSVIDYSNSTPYTLEEILLNHWMYLSSVDKYTAFITATNPRTGEVLTFTVKEAYVFVWYAFCRVHNVVVDVIPQVFAKRVQRIPTATVDDIMSVVDSSIVSRSIAVQALSIQPEIGHIISTEAFYNTCVKIYNAAQMQRNLMSSQEHGVRRGMVHGMVTRIYSDNMCKNADVGQTYTNWFATRNIDIASFTNTDLDSLYVDIVRNATGLSLKTAKTLKDLQAAMVKMLTQLSSYSVQPIAEINNSTIKKTDWPAVRVGNMDTRTNEHLYHPDTVSEVQSIGSTWHNRFAYNTNNASVREVLHTKTSQLEHVNAGLTIKHSHLADEIRYFKVNIGTVRVSATNPAHANSLGIVPVIGVDEYMLLDPIDRQSFKDVYNGGYSPIDTENVVGPYMAPGYVQANYTIR